MKLFNLEDVEQRLYEVKKISRKHNIHAEELLYLQEELEKQLSSYENFDEENDGPTLVFDDFDQSADYDVPAYIRKQNR